MTESSCNLSEFAEKENQGEPFPQVSGPENQTMQNLVEPDAVADQ